MHRHRSTIVRRLALALGGTALVAVCFAVGADGASPAQAQSASAVSIIDFAFQPASVSVPVGSTFTWTNNGSAPHTTTSSAGGWDSGRLTSGDSFNVTFSQPGSFSYMCTIHPQMVGTVIVQAAAAAAPAAAPAAAQPAPRPAAAAPTAQRPAAAPAAAAPRAQAAAAAPAPAALPRSGAGGALTVDNRQVLPALAVGAALLAGLTTLAYRRRSL